MSRGEDTKLKPRTPRTQRAGRPPRKTPPFVEERRAEIEQEVEDRIARLRYVEKLGDGLRLFRDGYARLIEALAIREAIPAPMHPATAIPAELEQLRQLQLEQVRAETAGLPGDTPGLKEALASLENPPRPHLANLDLAQRLAFFMQRTIRAEIEATVGFENVPVPIQKPLEILEDVLRDLGLKDREIVEFRHAGRPRAGVDEEASRKKENQRRYAASRRLAIEKMVSPVVDGVRNTAIDFLQAALASSTDAPDAATLAQALITNLEAPSGTAAVLAARKWLTVFCAVHGEAAVEALRELKLMTEGAPKRKTAAPRTRKADQSQGKK